jgi:excisionase family DNA binding protein
MNATAAQPRLYTVRDIAERLEVSIQTVRKLCHSGRIPRPLGLSRSPWLWPADEFEAFLASRPTRPVL